MKFQIHTVPGQVIYNVTRQLVLRGVDGIVFVADSQIEKHQENMESFQNLRENLRVFHLDLEEIPLVLQYNKMDLRWELPDNYTDSLLGNLAAKTPVLKSVANRCKGVIETFDMLKRLLLSKFLDQSA